MSELDWSNDKNVVNNLKNLETSGEMSKELNALSHDKLLHIQKVLKQQHDQNGFLTKDQDLALTDDGKLHYMANKDGHRGYQEFDIAKRLGELAQKDRDRFNATHFYLNEGPNGEVKISNVGAAEGHRREDLDAHKGMIAKGSHGQDQISNVGAAKGHADEDLAFKKNQKNPYGKKNEPAFGTSAEEVGGPPNTVIASQIDSTAHFLADQKSWMSKFDNTSTAKDFEKFGQQFANGSPADVLKGISEWEDKNGHMDARWRSMVWRGAGREADWIPNDPAGKIIKDNIEKDLHSNQA